jgi:putative transposase
MKICATSASMVISLTAKGLTTGEVEAHLMDVYSTEISRETISKMSDRSRC